jgi:hypothetical protein
MFTNSFCILYLFYLSIDLLAGGGCCQGHDMLAMFVDAYLERGRTTLIAHPRLVTCNLRLYDTMLNFVENLLENERDPRSGPMNEQDHSLSLSDPDRSLVLSHFLTNFLQNLASCHTAFKQSLESLVLLKYSNNFINVSLYYKKITDL